LVTLFIIGGVGEGKSIEAPVKAIRAQNADALHATRAAMEEGLVAAGGVARPRARANNKVKGDDRLTDCRSSI
jgi:hypothetical protein